MAQCNFDSCPLPEGGTREWLHPYGVPLSVQDTKGWCDKDVEFGTDMGTVDKAYNHPCGMVVQNNNRYLSSFLNLLIIQSFGQIYEFITAKLNEMENHRSSAEWQNSLVVKNFAFQFVNNYFMLFYIAFIRDYLAEASLAATEASVASGTESDISDTSISFGDSRAEIGKSASNPVVACCL